VVVCIVFDIFAVIMFISRMNCEMALAVLENGKKLLVVSAADNKHWNDRVLSRKDHAMGSCMDI